MLGGGDSAIVRGQPVVGVAVGVTSLLPPFHHVAPGDQTHRLGLAEGTLTG